MHLSFSTCRCYSESKHFPQLFKVYIGILTAKLKSGKLNVNIDPEVPALVHPGRVMSATRSPMEY